MLHLQSYPLLFNRIIYLSLLSALIGMPMMRYCFWRYVFLILSFNLQSVDCAVVSDLVLLISNIRELKCMAWETGQKLLSTWEQRQKNSV